MRTPQFRSPHTVMSVESAEAERGKAVAMPSAAMSERRDGMLTMRDTASASAPQPHILR